MTDSASSPLARFVGLFAVLFLIAGMAIALGGGDDRRRGGDPIALGDVRLVSVESCDELLDWYRTVATETDAIALGGGMLFEGDAVAEDAVAMPMAGSTAATGSASGGTGGEGGPGGDESAERADSFSGTNLQELDVDEPDTVKTDGDILVHLSYDKLEIVDVGDGEPTLLSTVALEQGGGEILLSGDRVLVLGTVWRQSSSSPQPAGAADERMMMMPVDGEQVTVLTSIDVSDPTDPRVVETREIPGGYRSARATGTAVRIVIVTSPQLPQPGPAVYESGDPATYEAWKNEAIASMTLDDWSPNAGQDCASVTRTEEPEGMSTTSVITLDLQGSLEELDRDSVVADAGTIYASSDRLLIATSRWSQTSNPDGQVSTELHAFDISDPAQTTYVASGAVSGYLLNQFALSAHEGNLRVATTEEAPWNPETGTQQSESGITVLDASMQQIGRIDGLGVTERIQAVRYLGDVAFVVTFRQTDPLFAIDLSDPTAPRVAGELKIPGYSAYLHPIDDGRLVGVGQDATDQGQVLGTQVSTFDISDIAAPTRIDALRIDSASSAVEYDHRAFLWWDATRSVVIPIEIYPQVDCPPDADCMISEAQARPYQGAVVFDIGADGSIAERGRVTHVGRGAQDEGWYPVTRSLVVGDALYTVSDAGVLKSDLATLDDGGFAAFPAADQSFGEPTPVGDGTIEPAPLPAEG